MEYWTIIDDRHAGPFSAEELVAKGIGLDTPVWISGLPDWVEAREIQELRALIEARPAQEEEPAACNQEVIADKTKRIETGQLPPAPVPEPPIPPARPAEPQPQQPAPQQTAPAQPAPQQAAPMQQAPMQPNCPPPGYPPQGFYPQGYYPQGPQPWQPMPQPMPAPQQRRQQRPVRPPQPKPQPQQQWDWQQEPKEIPEGAEVPPAYLVWAILSTVLCCIPLGIPAIIFSAQTRSAIKKGDLEKARKMSDRTQWCIILAIVLGLISMPLQLVFSNF